jgi:DNA-binding CsgD family transcriptional regulator
LYALTPTEAQLTALLMQGVSLAEAADQLRVSRHTIRNHLKNIFAKTGAGRQAELVRQLLIGPTQLMFDETTTRQEKRLAHD